MLILQCHKPFCIKLATQSVITGFTESLTGGTVKSRIYEVQNLYTGVRPTEISYIL